MWRCQVCDGSDWSKVVDNGFGNADARLSGSLRVFNSYLYFIFGNWDTGMEVWRSSDGTTWAPLAPGGLGDSNNVYPYWDNSVAIFNNTLYMGV